MQMRVVVLAETAAVAVLRHAEVGGPRADGVVQVFLLVEVVQLCTPHVAFALLGMRHPALLQLELLPHSACRELRALLSLNNCLFGDGRHGLFRRQRQLQRRRPFAGAPRPVVFH